MPLARAETVALPFVSDWLKKENMFSRIGWSELV